jgi:uncharacterized phosphosugar-binding protein
MEAPGFRQYVEQVEELLKQARERVAPAVAEAATLIARAIADGRVLYVFGASHAGILAQDLFYRAGGLAAIEPILPAGLMLNERPIVRTTRLERLEGYGALILQDTTIGSGDVLLIISVSGRNPVAVDMCTAARARGAHIIALTNLTYSRSVTARGSHRLFEVADTIIDLPGHVGDASVCLDGLRQAVGPTSTAVGSAIMQGLMVEVSEKLLALGEKPPVFTSANLDGADAANVQLLEAYRGRVSYL